jgi:hypothetical protein
MTKQNLIRAVVIEVDKLPKLTKIENTLEAFQKLVGGYIEVVRLDEGICAVINEEGKLLDLEPNILLRHDYLAGTVVLVTTDGEGEFAGISKEQVKALEGMEFGLIANGLR